MRALGAELGVQQSALYHHVASKQELLGLVADAILERAPRRPARADASWQTRVRRRCEDVRAAVLAYPDGADLVLSMWAFGLGAALPRRATRAAARSRSRGASRIDRVPDPAPLRLRPRLRPAGARPRGASRRGRRPLPRRLRRRAGARRRRHRVALTQTRSTQTRSGTRPRPSASRRRRAQASSSAVAKKSPTTSSRCPRSFAAKRIGWYCVMS